MQHEPFGKLRMDAEAQKKKCHSRAGQIDSIRAGMTKRRAGRGGFLKEFE